jgi:hypothetical protein
MRMQYEYAAYSMRCDVGVLEHVFQVFWIGFSVTALTIHPLSTHYTPTIHSLYTHYTGVLDRPLLLYSLSTHYPLTIHSLYRCSGSASL